VVKWILSAGNRRGRRFVFGCRRSRSRPLLHGPSVSDCQHLLLVSIEPQPLSNNAPRLLAILEVLVNPASNCVLSAVEVSDVGLDV
jgi:hypothetical protein